MVTSLKLQSSPLLSVLHRELSLCPHYAYHYVVHPLYSTGFNHHIFWKWIEVHFAFGFDGRFTHNSALLQAVAVIFRPQISDQSGSDLIKLLQISPHLKWESSIS